MEEHIGVSARSLLVWFQVDVPAEWGEDESWAMLDYADDHERVSLSRLAVLENLWQRLYGPKGA